MVPNGNFCCQLLADHLIWSALLNINARIRPLRTVWQSRRATNEQEVNIFEGLIAGLRVKEVEDWDKCKLRSRQRSLFIN
jgi:hypothetical protein